MSKIKAYTSYSERTNTRYYREFDVIEEIPEVEDLNELIGNEQLNSRLDNKRCIKLEKVSLYTEQGNDEVYEYEYYEATLVDIGDYHQDEEQDKKIEDYIEIKYIAVKSELELEEEED